MEKIFSARLLIAVSVISAGIFSTPLVKSTFNDSVTFFEHEPEMNGVIYQDILSLPERPFNSTQAEGENSTEVQANYRLAYGIGFFYIMIEYESDTITYRDRAYQNGDGFIVTIARPKLNGAPADEFYVLGFSPGDNLTNIKARKFIWYRNIDLSFEPLKESKFCSTVMNNKVYLQALVYWKETYPFHPAFEEGIGFNLCFVKACNGNNKLYYFDKFDNNIQSEQSLREYEILKFARPLNLNIPQLYCILSRNYITRKEDLSLMACCIGKPSCVVKLLVSINADDNSYFLKDEYSIYNSKGCTKMFFDIPVNKLPFKNYNLKWQAGTYSSGNIKFSLLPEFNFVKQKEEAEGVRGKICEGSYSTIRFLIDDIASRYEKLKIYESCPDILRYLTDLNTIMSSAGKEIDTLIKKEGLYRRGFLSKYDSTYRPYSIRVPVKFNRYKTYPLLVYLHGSGDDDRFAVKQKAFSKGNFIEMYPNGRGTSNAYCSPESQIDITEAVNDVINNYPIDTSCIILAGFSMGGYGVYRTFYEHPEMYKALAVFSGHPNLANQWLGEGYPDFLQEKYLEKFNGVNLFIFHGTEDRNCPFELTEQLIEKLKSAGANVEFVTEVTGHSSPSEDSNKLFLNWLEGILNLKKGLED